jgi:signal transduction histidine kinase
VENKAPRRLNTIGAHLVALVVVPVVLLAGTIFFGVREDFHKAERSARDQAATIAHLASSEVTDELESLETEVAMMPQYAGVLLTPSICEIVSEEQQEAFSDGLRESLAILRADGSPICPGGPTEGIDVAGQTWFRSALSSPEPVIVGPAAIAGLGDQLMIYAIAVSEPKTVLVTIVDLRSFVPLLERRFSRNGSDMDFVLTSSDRQTLISGHGGRSGRSLAGTGFASTGAGVMSFDGVDAVERIYAHEAIPDHGWYLYAGIATDDAFAAATESLRERIFLGIVVILVMLLATFVLARRFARPIRALVKVSERFGAGDAKAKVTPSGPAELKELGQSVNQMMRVRAEAEAALKKAYQAERKAADDLRDLDEMRTAFLRAISHELRTPLTSVVGYATFLDESMDVMPEDSVKSSIKAISTQSKRLERLLLDLLDVERISRGTIEPNYVDVDLGKLALNVVEQTSANRRIKVDVKGAVPATVDAALVERIVENLVFNAMKHTPAEANIWVKVRRHNGHVKIQVDDSGNGVPDELKTAIFEPFTQGEVPQHSPGTGVGLNLVSQFAKLHGGRAWVEDRRGGGASFRVELPAKPASAKSRKRAAA